MFFFLIKLSGICYFAQFSVSRFARNITTVTRRIRTGRIFLSGAVYCLTRDARINRNLAGKNISTRGIFFRARSRESATPPR